MESLEVREKAINEIVRLLDSGFLTALTDPVRVQLIKLLVLKGRMNIEDLSSHFSQDRSVISRHLLHLYREGLVGKEKRGRLVQYEIRAGYILNRFKTISSELEKMIIICCGPFTEAPKLAKSQSKKKQKRQ